MDNLYDLELQKILPSSISGDPNVQAMAKALDPELQSVSHDTREALIIPRIDELSEPVIDLLAWQWHVDFYDPSLPLETRRELVKKSIEWHSRKGTPSVVEEIVRTVFRDGTVSEWFEYGGDPYRFRIETTAGINDPKVFDMLGRAIFAVKNTRSWLDSITLLSQYHSKPLIGIANYVKDEVLIRERPREFQILTEPRMAFAVRVIDEVRVGRW
jgi:phage tail P2-like protein